MRNITSMAFWLILILILVAYYTGTSSVVSSFGGAINQIITTLQGRNSKGDFAAFPKQS